MTRASKSCDVVVDVDGCRGCLFSSDDDEVGDASRKKVRDGLYQISGNLCLLSVQLLADYAPGKIRQARVYKHPKIATEFIFCVLFDFHPVSLTIVIFSHGKINGVWTCLEAPSIVAPQLPVCAKTDRNWAQSK